MMEWLLLGAGLGVGLGLFAVFWIRARRGLLHVNGVLHVNVNCSDFERSKAFYEMLGFRVMMDVAPDGEGDVAAAVGLGRYRVKGALMLHGDGFTLDLLEWQEPHDARRPDRTLQQLGLARIALVTTDLDADVASLRAEGVRFLSERPGVVPDPTGGTTRFICFEDPDGTVLELVEMGRVMGGLQGVSQRMSRFKRAWRG